MNYLIPILLSFFLLSCHNTAKKEYAEVTDTPATLQEPHPGKKLMETYCYVCHSPSAAMEDRIAPPMVAVKMHYISEDTSKEDFMNAFTQWMKAPSEENAKMPGAVRKFGVMPYQPYTDEVIQQIGEYLYEYDIEQPEWFEDHFNQEHGKGKGKGKGKQMRQGMGSSQTPASYEEKGLQMALSTKAVLGKNLMGKIQQEGTLAALEFCNVKAYPITDSMATAHQASIKRVSDNYRNPNNKASSQEIQYLQKFQQDITAGKEPQAIVDSTSNKVNFYYPIVTNSMCL